MEYMTAREADAKWGLGIRVVALYCSEGRIDGAVKKGNLWLIPRHALTVGIRAKWPLNNYVETSIRRWITRLGKKTKNFHRGL